MSMISGSPMTCIAHETIPAGARVKRRSDLKVELADAADREMGTALLHGAKSSYAAGEPVPVVLINHPGTQICIAGDTIAAGDTVKRAADGRVAVVSGDGSNYGVAQSAATVGQYVEVLRDPTFETTVADGAVTTPKLAAGGVTAPKLADVVADAIPDVTVAVANAGTPDGAAYVTMQLKDVQGNNLAARGVVHFWFAQSAAWAAPADLGTLSVTTGTLLTADLADADSRVLTDATGLAVLKLQLASSPGTVHAHAHVNGLPKTANAAITG